MTDLDNEPVEPDTPSVEDRAVSPRSRAIGAAVIGARIVAGSVGIAIAAATVIAATWLPLPTVTATPPSVAVHPVAATQQRVCAGPLLTFGDKSGLDASTATSVGRPRVQRAQSEGSAEHSALEHTDNTAGVAPEVVSLPPSALGGSKAPALAGSQSQFADTGDTVGLAAAQCVEGSGDSWLVGCATDTGRTTIVTLSNPTQVRATVTLSIYAESGPISAAGTDGIVVPPQTQRIVSLAAFAPGVVSPVVRVQSQGGQIVANLQQSTVRTLEPGGVDLVGATTSPSKLAVIPGVVIAGSAATVAREPQPGYSDLRTVARLFVPGTGVAQVELTIASEDGSAPRKPVRLRVQGGAATDVPLDDFGDGAYTVSVASDLPLVAAVRVATVGASGANDFSWHAAAPVLSDDALVSVAEGVGSVIHLANRSDGTERVTVTSTDGVAIPVTVPKAGSVAVPVTAGASYSVSGFDALSMAVSYTGDGQLAGFTVTPSAPASRPIIVYP